MKHQRKSPRPEGMSRKTIRKIATRERIRLKSMFVDETHVTTKEDWEVLKGAKENANNAS